MFTNGQLKELQTLMDSVDTMQVAFIIESSNFYFKLPCGRAKSTNQFATAVRWITTAYLKYPRCTS
jgi:hypothetical protein